MKRASILALAAALILASLAQAQEKGFLWDGNQWPQLSYDAKVGYIKGIGNLADFEVASSKGKGPPISLAFVSELKAKTVEQIIKEVDNYYQENPGKLGTTVLEVMLIKCTTVCPPGTPGAKKK
jgi:hypothetical protein